MLPQPSFSVATSPAKPRKNSFCMVALALLNLLTACGVQQEPTLTTVDGSLINKYTRQPIASVPVELKTWRYGLYGNLRVDSVLSTRTDAEGKFHLAFDAKEEGATYRVRFRDYHNLFDLTDYRPFDSKSFSDGASLVLGQANHVNFEATPFVPVQIVVDTNKGGKNSLDISFFSIYPYADNGDGFWGYVLTDTARTRQRITARRLVRVVPNRRYRFLLNRYNTIRAPNGSVSLSNEVLSGFDRFIGYSDTTIIQVQ